MPLVPLYDQYGVTGGYSPQVRQMTAPEQAPGFWPTLGAAFRQENTIGSALSQQTGYTFERDPTYDAWRDIQDTPYAQYFDRFINISNPNDANIMKSQIDMEVRDRTLLSTSGLMGTIASMVASGADWTSLLPGGAVYRTAKLGVNLARSALAVGAAAGGATVLQEAILQNTQVLRTPTESALNIGGSVIIGGILGAGGAAILGPAFNSLSRQLEREVSGVLAEAGGAPVRVPQSASDTPLDTPQAVIDRALGDIAQITPSRIFDLDAEGNTIMGRAASFLGRSVYFMNPLLRGLTSPSERYRNVTTALLENTIYMTRNMTGGASTQAVETLMKEWTRGVLADVVSNQRTVFRNMRVAGINMTYQQFSDEVGRALRNGGSPNEFIQRTAQYYSDRLFKPLTQQGIDAGLFPAGTTVDSVASGFTRVWNTRMVERNEAEFRTTVNQWANEQADARLAESATANAHRISQARAEIEALREATAGRLTNVTRVVDADPAPLEAALRNITPDMVDEPHISHILSNPNDMAAISVALGRAGITEFEYLGAGADALVFRAGDRVVRFRPGTPPPGVPNDPLYIRPIYSGQFGDTRVDVFPFVDTTRVTDDDVQTVIEELASRGRVWSDPGENNLGKIGDRLIILDGDIVDETSLADIGMAAAPNFPRARMMTQSRGVAPMTSDTTFINLAQFDTAVRMAIAGDTAPKPSTLTSFLLRAGGLVDEDGLLKRAGITSRTRIGLIRKNLRTGPGATGGLALDDAIELAFNGRFFETKPTREQFIEMLADDASGRRITSAVDDREAAQLWNLTNEINKAIERNGVTPDMLRSKRGRAYKNILAEINKLYDTRDKALASELKLRIERLEADTADQARRFAPGTAERAAYTKDIEDTVFNKITGRETGDEPTGMTVASFGPMKEKMFDIPHQRIAKYLIDDVQLVAGRFARTMSADVNLKNRFGSVGLKDVRNSIAEEYAELRKKVASETKDEGLRSKLLARLSKREKADLRDLDNVRDLLRGSFQRRHNTGNFARIAAVAQTWNFIRALGGVVISSLTDLTRAIMVHGLGPTIKFGVIPLIRNIKKDGGFRLAVREAKIGGAVGESILNSRLANWTEIMDPESVVSPVDRFMTNLSGAFSRVSGMVYWNDMQKSFASVITQNRILRDVAMYAGLSKKERAYLAYLGIDQNMAKRIHGEYMRASNTAPHIAGEHDGVLVAGTEVWQNAGTRSAFRAALNKDVDSIIVTKGIGDVPVFANTPIGRVLLQFRSFALASHQRVLMRGVQENHAGVYLGMVSTVLWGMFIYYLRTKERGEEPSDNPGRWIAEGIDRSGLLSVFMEVNNAAEQVGLPGVFKGAQAAFPNASQQPPPSRFAAESAVSSVAGPTVGLVEDIAGLVGLPWRENVTEADVRAGARLLPGRNLPGLKTWFDTNIIPFLSENAR